MSAAVAAARVAILAPEKAHERVDVLARPSSIPEVPGLYGWYFDELPPRVPDEGLHRIGAGALLYVGISPKEPPKNGKPPSKSNLRKRIKAHFRRRVASVCRWTPGQRWGQRGSLLA